MPKSAQFAVILGGLLLYHPMKRAAGSGQGVDAARVCLDGSPERLTGILELSYGGHWVTAPESPEPWSVEQGGEIHRYPPAGQSLARAHRELGEIGNELENLGSQTRSSELRLDRSVAVESLTGLAREWAVVSLALHMIRKATQRYEQERQPEVLRQGQFFLTKMTGGRYKRISPIVGERQFEVLRDDSSKLPPEKLSRGTAEQLYLALRFGLVRELSRHREALPIMMDDILVNFDPARAEAACEAIVEMAQTHQVIYFTCHPHIQELFVNNNPEIKVLELS